MLKLLLLLSVTSLSLVVGVVLFFGLAWMIVAIPVILLWGGGTGAVALRRRVLAQRVGSPSDSPA